MKDGREGEVIVRTLVAVEVGTDDDGDPITSCVIRSAEALAKATKEPRVKGHAAIAFDLLCRTLDDAGEQPPASNHIPSSVKRVVRYELWREYFLNGTGQEADKITDKDSRSKAFRRASQRLQEIKAIGIWNDMVWTTSGHDRTDLFLREHHTGQTRTYIYRYVRLSGACPFMGSYNLVGVPSGVARRMCSRAARMTFGRSGFLAHLHSSMVTMSQKSSLPQILNLSQRC